MVLTRLWLPRVRYLECHCGGRVGLHTYPAATLLWLCEVCACTHEAHQNTQRWPDEGITYARGRPLGVPADRACKALRLQIHEELAVVREQRGWSKSATYQWLAVALDLPRPETHIALFDISRCVQVLRICAEARL